MVALETIRPQIFAGSSSTAKVKLGGLLVVMVALTAVAFGNRPAHAQTSCDVRESLLAKLDTGYSEKPVAIGLASSGNVVELLISSDGTWTILVTKPNGIACVAAVGEEWQALDPPLGDEAS
jgi:hypothetical protein